MKNYKRLTERYIDENGNKCVKPLVWEGEILHSLAELEDKIENGTLVELPCKVGDTVYYETFINNGSESVGIQPHEVKSIYTSIVTSNFGGYAYTIVKLDEFGKTVFLTKTEAEEKLKELQNAKNK